MGAERRTATTAVAVVAAALVVLRFPLLLHRARELADTANRELNERSRALEPSEARCAHHDRRAPRRHAEPGEPFGERLDTDCLEALDVADRLDVWRAQAAELVSRPVAADSDLRDR